MTDIFRTVVTMSISGSIVAILLCMLRPLLKNKISKSVQYYIWLIVIVQMLIPFKWEFSVPVDSEARQVVPEIATIHEAVDKYVITTEEEKDRMSVFTAAHPDYTPLDVQQLESKTIITIPTTFLVALFWPLGTVVSLLWSIVAYLVFVFKVKRTSTIWRSVECTLPVYKSKMATTPMLIGILKPIIILPDQEFAEQPLKYILLHELTHHRRKDIIIKWLMTFAVALHWFNPAVYFVRKEVNRACELSCDEAVIQSLDNFGKQGYGDTLISVVAESRYPVGVISTTMCEEKKTLKERLVSIMKYKKPSKMLMAASVVIVAAVISCAFVLAGRRGEPKHPLESSGDLYEQQFYKGYDDVKNIIPYVEPLMDGLHQPEDKLILNFDNVDKIEVKHNDFNEFDKEYKPFVTSDKHAIELMTSMMKNCEVISDSEYNEINRPNNSVATITIYEPKDKKELEFVIDTLYHKSVFTIDGIHYSPEYNFARLVQHMEEFRPQNIEIEEPVKSMLNAYGLSPAFLISAQPVRLPDNLLYKSGEFPIKLYWSHNLQLSKEIGLDFSDFLGETLKAELYYLVNPLPQTYYPQLDAYAVVLRNSEKIVGAYMSAGRAGFASSISQRSFQDITGSTFDNWFAKNGYDMSDPVTISNAKLTPEEMISRYFEAIDKGDDSHFQYESIRKLRDYLYVNMDERKLFLSGWYEDIPDDLGHNTESVELLSLEKNNELSSENEQIVRIKIDVKVKQVITHDSGIDILDLRIVKDGNAGWKIVGMGH